MNSIHLDRQDEQVGPQSHSEIQPQHLTTNKRERANIKRQRPCVLWFTGLSGAGKSSTADLIEVRLHAMGHHTYLLDGDNIRGGLNRDLSFSAADRVENIRRVAEVSKLMVDAGLIVLVCLISPYREERKNARNLFCTHEFVEVFVDVPLEIAEKRDPKGLYRKARQGSITNFTGIGAPYEAPNSPEIHLHSAAVSLSDNASTVIRYLASNSYLL